MFVYTREPNHKNKPTMEVLLEGTSKGTSTFVNKTVDVPRHVQTIGSMSTKLINPISFGSRDSSPTIDPTPVRNVFLRYENSTFRVSIMFKIIVPGDIMFVSKPFLLFVMCSPNLTCNMRIVRPTYSKPHGHLKRYTTHLVVHVIKDFMGYVTPVPSDVNSVSLLSCNALTLQTLHFLQGKNLLGHKKHWTYRGVWDVGCY